jgi:hypothetical protein
MGEGDVGGGELVPVDGGRRSHRLELGDPAHRDPVVGHRHVDHRAVHDRDPSARLAVGGSEEGPGSDRIPRTGGGGEVLEIEPEIDITPGLLGPGGEGLGLERRIGAGHLFHTPGGLALGDLVLGGAVERAHVHISGTKKSVTPMV